jgi:hypothetical protein
VYSPCSPGRACKRLHAFPHNLSWPSLVSGSTRARGAAAIYTVTSVHYVLWRSVNTQRGRLVSRAVCG